MSVPFDLTAAGTSAAIELTGLAAELVVAAELVAAGFVLLALLPQPVTTSAVTASSAACEHRVPYSVSSHEKLRAYGQIDPTMVAA